MKELNANVPFPHRRSYAFASAVMLCLFLGTGLFPISLASKANAFELFGKKFFEAASEETIVADALNYSVTLSAAGLDNEETELLRNISLLVIDQAKPVSGSLGLLTKAKSDRDNLVGALYEQARYAGVVTISINGRNIDDLEPTAEFARSTPPSVAIEISGGKKFKFGKTELVGDTNLQPADFKIQSGGIASSNTIIEAQDEIVQRLKQEGFPLAAVKDAAIVADHDSGLLDIRIFYEAGPKAPIGMTLVTGSNEVDPEFIKEQAMLEDGSQYSPAKLAEAKKRLQALGVFESITVTESETLDANGRVPISIEVKERKLRYFGAGATYSNADGAGIEGYWGHRNLFGRAEKLRIEGGISRIGENADPAKMNYSTAILFEKPAAFGPNASFLANARAVSENYDAFERRSVRGGFGIRNILDKTQTLSAALDVDWSMITEGKVETNHLIFSMPLEYTYDGSDNKLDPSKGIRFAALLEPATDIETGATFVKGRLTGSAYLTPTNAEYVTFAARASVGSILGADLNMIPADRRFYAGGGGSVRGFAFQAIGPQDATGRVTGGRSIVEGSLEARIQISEKLGLVPFVDVGNVYQSSTPSFSDLRMGVGMGLRYQTPFGPLRLDVGVPIDRRAGEDNWALYAGIGQAF